MLVVCSTLEVQDTELISDQLLLYAARQKNTYKVIDPALESSQNLYVLL